MDSRKTERATTRPQFTPRRIVIVVVVVVGLWAASATLDAPALLDVEASVDPIGLPRDGASPAVSISEFEGILVGSNASPV